MLLLKGAAVGNPSVHTHSVSCIDARLVLTPCGNKAGKTLCTRLPPCRHGTDCLLATPVKWESEKPVQCGASKSCLQHVVMRD